jgi:hypothetical protein
MGDLVRDRPLGCGGGQRPVGRVETSHHLVDAVALLGHVGDHVL